MKKIIFSILRPTFGSRKFRRFYEVLKNISFLGLNYRNTDPRSNGENFFISFVTRHIKPSEKNIIIFDVGANVGNYTLQLNHLSGKNRKIYSFEPFSAVYKELVKLSTIVSEFYPFQLGFSDKRESKKFFSSSSYSEVGGLYEKDFSDSGFSLDLSEEVFFDTIDEFCLDKNIPHIHFLKVDVEGHDYFVLCGAKRMIREEKIDFIQFEYGAANYLSKTYLFDFFKLLSPTYRVFRLLKNGAIEITDYNTDIEIHILCNYIAIRRKLDLNI